MSTLQNPHSCRDAGTSSGRVQSAYLLGRFHPRVHFCSLVLPASSGLALHEMLMISNTDQLLLREQRSDWSPSHIRESRGLITSGCLEVSGVDKGGGWNCMSTCCSSGCGSLMGAGFTRLVMPVSVGPFMLRAFRSSSKCSCSSNRHEYTSWQR